MSNQLKKTLGLSAALSTVVGMVIGSGVFFKPQAIYTATNGAPGLGIIAWILGGIITITAGLTAAEVSAAIPRTGGMMVYIEEIYGKKLGFLTGWMQTVLFFPGTIAALAVIFAKQVAELLGYNSGNMSVVLPVAIAIILFLALLNTIASGLILEYSLKNDKKTILILSYIIRILIIIIIALPFLNNLIQLITYLIGYILHFAVIIFYWIKTGKGSD